MGIFDWLFGRKKQATKQERADGAEPARKTTLTVDPPQPRQAAAADGAGPRAPAKRTAKKAARKAPKKAAKKTARKSTKKTAKKTARKSTKKTAKKTARKAPAKRAKKAAASTGGARSQVTHNSYKLFQKGNRYFFSKKAQKDVDGEPVYRMPAGRSVVTTPNGMPVLKKN